MGLHRLTYLWDAAFQGMRPREMFGLQKIYVAPAWPASDPDPEQREESCERYAAMPATRVQFQHQCVHGKRALTDPKHDSHPTAPSSRRPPHPVAGRARRHSHDGIGLDLEAVGSPCC
ncbi:hypothetical protein A6A06_15520 [Streptomyces sp. CB02923]|nr:hypothetical protein A6A06_15520 [Streptomyces sp. CB02923]